MKSLIKLIVCYAETDQMGLAHHANYPIWFECGRTQFFADLGFSYSFIEKKGLLLPLTEMQCAFFSPLRTRTRLR